METTPFPTAMTTILPLAIRTESAYGVQAQSFCDSQLGQPLSV